jgi:hypothetical protein
MRFFRQPKNGSIKRIQLEFSAQADLLESIESAIRLARSMSEKFCSCRAVFNFHGVEIEVSEFSNADDLVCYYSMRRRMQRTGTIFERRA